MSHIYHFAQTALLTNVHCNELSVWFKVSGGYVINTSYSPRLLSDILLFLPVMQIFSLWFCRASPSGDPLAPSWFQYWGGPAQALDLSQGGKAELISPLYLSCPRHWKYHALPVKRSGPALQSPRSTQRLGHLSCPHITTLATADVG